MKKTFLPVLFVLSTFLIGCGASQKVTSFWDNPAQSPDRPYKSVFIVALTQDRAARNTVEADLAAAATAHGIKATRSVDVFPGTFTKETAPSKEEMLGKIRELGCDAIFTVSLLDTKSEQRYVPGTTTYAPYPHFGYYGHFYGYYGHMYPVVSTPGYYTTDKTYFLEGNLYDAASEEIQWSIQSTAYNPSGLSSFSKGYAELLINTLTKEK